MRLARKQLEEVRREAARPGVAWGSRGGDADQDQEESGGRGTAEPANGLDVNERDPRMWAALLPLARAQGSVPAGGSKATVQPCRSLLRPQLRHLSAAHLGQAPQSPCKQESSSNPQAAVETHREAPSAARPQRLALHRHCTDRSCYLYLAWRCYILS